MTSQQCGPWIIHRCNNCQTVTHATQSNLDEKRALVSSDLLVSITLVHLTVLSTDSILLLLYWACNLICCIIFLAPIFVH